MTPPRPSRRSRCPPWSSPAPPAPISGPALVTPGDLDDTTRPEASETMAQTIPNASMHVLRPARHLGHMEHHDEFARAVGQFVTSLSLTGVTQAEDAIAR